MFYMIYCIICSKFSLFINNHHIKPFPIYIQLDEKLSNKFLFSATFKRLNSYTFIFSSTDFPRGLSNSLRYHSSASFVHLSSIIPAMYVPFKSLYIPHYIHYTCRTFHPHISFLISPRYAELTKIHTFSALDFIQHLRFQRSNFKQKSLIYMQSGTFFI